MRAIAAATAAALLIGWAPVQAQTPLTGTTGPLASSPPRAAATPVGRGTEQPAPAIAEPTPHRRRATLAERFAEANTTGDGHLTLEQARAKMPSVARQFTEIDTAKKGYVTLDEIKDHAKQVRAARRAARAAAKVQ